MNAGRRKARGFLFERVKGTQTCPLCQINHPVGNGKMSEINELKENSRLDEHFMRLAMKQALRAQALDEVPIGCVIVHDGRVIARGYNRRNTDMSATAHAEISAIRKAGRKLGDWRLEGCTIYITLEPCQMCAGAIVQARIDRCVIACMNPKAGCAGSILNVLRDERFNHQVALTTGVLQEDCSRMLSDYFKDLRLRKRENRQEQKQGQEQEQEQEQA